MIRVGFVMEFDAGWHGGVNYYRNLLQAVYALPERKIEPVIFLGQKSGVNRLSGLPPFDVVRSTMLDRHSFAWLLRKITIKLFKRDLLLELLLRKKRINVLSHSGSLGRGSTMPCLCWMADFQHKRMPQFFGTQEIRLRDSTIQAWCDACSVIILSSHDAQNDLRTFYPDCHGRQEVLQFVSAVDIGKHADMREIVAHNGGVPEKFFLVANQFWAHKNHQVLLDALKHLKASGRDIKIIATGNVHDFRQPEYFSRLIANAQTSGVSDNFTVLGMVSMERLAMLMQGAVAIINPSLFEGWNTAVEEAKSLGKKVVLSDIPVHREQNPERALYFNPHDAAGLAEILWRCWCEYSPAPERAEMKQAASAFPKRQRQFGESYQRIVLMSVRTGLIA